MIRRWCVYLAVLLGCLIFYMAYQGWLAWLLLMCVLWMPVFSLIISLPAMLCIRMSVGALGVIPVGTRAVVRASIRCPLPAPAYRYRIRVTRKITGESWRLSAGDTLPTDHCGQMECRLVRCSVFDYLGLFRVQIRKLQNSSIIVRPAPVQMDSPQDLQRYLSRAWRPKPGGGFAENHELRLYRPGDNLNQVHWKLSAKTGKLIIREAMEPERGRVMLTLDLKGSPGELDRKLGQLLWMGEHLLQQGLRYEIRALTGEGNLVLQVTTEQELNRAVNRLLCLPPAREGTIRDQQVTASWQLHIGGGTNEA